MQHRFHLLGNRHDTPDLLAALDVFTLCSLNEANPVSILEALASGLPVVSTAVGSIHETVIEGQTGFLVPSENAVALASRICEVLRSPTLAQQLGRNGREHIVRGWSLDSMVSGYENLISKIYDTKHPGYLQSMTAKQSAIAPGVVLPNISAPTPMLH